MNVLVAYDIPNDRRRNRVHRILRDFGQWAQFSVFECRLSEKNLVEMRARIRQEIDPKEDAVSIYRLCDACLRSAERIGGVQIRGDGPIIL